ncbi:MAG: glycoside hydrolase family 16 protein [Planctomycetota bacterium]
MINHAASGFAARTSILVVACCFGAVTEAEPPTDGRAPPRSADRFELCWADEFDSNGPPSPTNWSFEHGFKRNKELQWYQEDNAWCEDGCLVIEARRERRDLSLDERRLNTANWATRRPHAEYTSASLNTRNKHDWLYGRFVARARVPAVAGAWPAFWTLGYGAWPACGEIDVMEYYDESVLANVAWLGKKQSIVWDAVKTPVRELGEDSWRTSFHEFRMDWSQDSIDLYVDDKLLNTTRVADVETPAADGNPFRKPHYLLLNLAVGGRHGGDPSATAFPIRYEIDYVRVYQRRQVMDEPEATTSR